MNRLKNTLVELGWLEKENCDSREMGEQRTPPTNKHQKAEVGAHV